ncbi:hypothetical protein ABPG77_007503 [Micractinium sp. CCAP 211/92]
MPASLPQRPLAVPSRAKLLSLLLLLLAAASPLQAATVTLSSGTRSFDNSLDLSSAVGRTMQLLYTLTADGTLTAALVTDLTSSTEYAGLSFGAPHRGTPTVIYTTSFLDGYVLSGYQTATCNAGRGQWSVTGASVESAADGSGLLVGLFTGSGISSGSQTLGYAFGPYSGGVLGDHTRGGYPYGSVQATLQASASASSSSSPSPAAASPSPPTSASGGTPASAHSPPSRRPPASPTAPPSDSTAGTGGSTSSPNTSPGSSVDVPLLGGQVLSLPQWLQQEAAADPALMMGFVVSCMAGEPGAGGECGKVVAAGLDAATPYIPWSPSAAVAIHL